MGAEGEKTRSRGVGEEELGLDGLEKVQFFLLLFHPSFILNFQPYLFTAIKVGSSASLLKPWPIKTDFYYGMKLLLHSTLMWGYGIWYSAVYCYGNSFGIPS